MGEEVDEEVRDEDVIVNIRQWVTIFVKLLVVWWGGGDNVNDIFCCI